MSRLRPLGPLSLLLLSLSLSLLAGCGSEGPQGTELLNVSYDPTRELWRQINDAFILEYERQTGVLLKINQSHGGSSSQAGLVIQGNEADVVTLAMWPDTDAIRRAGLIAAGWETRLPNGSAPYSSTIVFVVRQGNPKQIKDWPDLVKGDVQIITPSPKTSGNGKLSFLAAWGSVTKRGGSEADAEKFVGELYRRVPVLDSGARAATATFSQKKIGDVHLTWENEAHFEVAESTASGETLEIVYPPISILAEPLVTWVDANVQRKGTEAAAKAYLEFLYTDRGQDIIARNHYRPSSAETLAAYREAFPVIDLFSVEKTFGNWTQAQEKYFAEGAAFDKLYQPGK